MCEKRIHSLDLLKVLGTICILCLHYQQFTQTVYSSGVNFYGGKVPFGVIVELFFEISGFLTARGGMEGRVEKNIYPLELLLRANA